MSKSTIVLSAKDDISGVLDKIIKKSEGFGSSMSGSVAKGMIAAQALVSTLRTVGQFLEKTYDFNVKTDKARISLAGVLAQAYDIQDAFSGSMLSGTEKLNGALVESSKIMKEMLALSIKTGASMEALQEAYSATIMTAAQSGFNASDVLDIVAQTEKLRQSMGIAKNQLAQEVKAIFSGNITNNHQIANTLGLKDNLDYQQALKSNDSEGMKKAFDEAIKYQKQAQEIQSKTASGAIETAQQLKDLFAADSSVGFLKPFERLHSIMDGVVDKNGEWNKSLKPIIDIGNDISEFFGNSIVNSIEATINIAKHFGDIVNGFDFGGIKSTLDSIWDSAVSVFEVFKKHLVEGSERLNVLARHFGGTEKSIEIILKGIAKIADEMSRVFSIILNTVDFFVDTFVTAIDFIISGLKAPFENMLIQAKKTYNEVVGMFSDSLKVEVEADIDVKSETMKNIEDYFSSTGDGYVERTKEKFKDISNAFLGIKEETVKKEEEIEEKSEEKIAEVKLSAHRNIEQEILKLTEESAGKSVDVWAKKLETVKDVANVNLKLGSIDLSKWNDVVNEIDEKIKNQKFEAVELEFAPKFEKVDTLLKEAEAKKDQDAYKKLSDAKLKIEKDRAEKLEQIEKEYYIKRSEQEMNYNKTKIDNILKQRAFEFSQIKEASEFKLKELALQHKQGLISDGELREARIKSIQEIGKAEIELINERIRYSNTALDLDKEKHQLLKAQQEQNIKLKEIELERFEISKKITKETSENQIALSKAINDASSRNLELNKKKGLVDLKEYYEEKQRLLQENYELEKRSLLNSEADSLKLKEAEVRYNQEVKEMIEEKTEAMTKYANSLNEVKSEYSKNKLGITDFDAKKQIDDNNISEKASMFNEEDRELVKQNERLKTIKENLLLINQELSELDNMRVDNINTINMLFLDGVISAEEMRNRITEQNSLYEAQQEKLKQIAESQRNEDLGSGINSQIDAIVSGSDKMKSVYEDLNMVGEKMGNVFSNNFSAILAGQKSVSQGFKAMFADLLNELTSMLAKKVFQDFLDSMSPMGKKGSGSLGGVLSTVFGGLGGIAGGKASGGVVRRGQPYLVGETGPEYVIPTADSRVLNTMQTSNLINNNNNNSKVINVTQNFTGPREKFEDSDLNTYLEFSGDLERSKRNS